MLSKLLKGRLLGRWRASSTN